MGRHKDTYTLPLDVNCTVTIGGQGETLIHGRIERGDRGRPVVVVVQDFESIAKKQRDVHLRHVTDQLERAHRQREWEWKRKTSEDARRIKELERRAKELEQAIDGAHAVAHKDQAAGQADPFAFLKRPDATAKPH